MSRITLNDWTCQLNACSHPLDVSAPLHSRAIKNYLPFSWVYAHLTMQNSHLSILPTDLSHILTGDVALSHIINCITTLINRTLPPNQLPPSPPSTSVTWLARRHITKLQDLGCWEFPPTLNTTTPSVLQVSFSLSPTNTHPPKYTQPLIVWLSSMAFLPLLTRSDPLILLPRLTRQLLAENYLLSLMHSPLFSYSYSLPPHFFASDGSQVPATTFQSPCGLTSPSVTVACVGSNRLFSSSLSLPSSFNQSASIFIAEVYGILLSSLLLKTATFSCSLHQAPSIFSDHLNSIKLLSSFQCLTTRTLTTNPAQSLYRWIDGVIQAIPSSAIPTYPPLSQPTFFSHLPSEPSTSSEHPRSSSSSTS